MIFNCVIEYGANKKYAFCTKFYTIIIGNKENVKINSETCKENAKKKSINIVHNNK